MNRTYYQVWWTDSRGWMPVETTRDLFPRSYASLDKARKVRRRFLAGHNVSPDSVAIRATDGVPWLRNLAPWRKVDVA